MTQKCELCKRSFNNVQGRFNVGPPTKHHVIPKQKFHGKWKDAEIILICRPCHKQIHRFFSNTELKYMSIEELKNDPKVKKWIQWIEKK